MATKKTLYRIPKNGIIAGVCAGLADYFNMDVTLMRVLFVVGAFISGLGLLLYIILAIILPVSGGAKSKK
jgi:phage shock protein PspC (stress-responsive transcriptional regulator)